MDYSLKRFMKVIDCLVFIVLPLNGFGQKKIEIPNNSFDSAYFNHIRKDVVKFILDDLTTTEDSLRIRIWMGNGIVEMIYSKNISAELTTWIYPTLPNGKPIFHYKTFDFKTSKALSDSIIYHGILEIEDDQSIGIDGSIYMFEIATPKGYRLYSYWSPYPARSLDSKKVSKILDSTSRILNLQKVMNDFIESLKPGSYQWGMSTIDLDYFLPEHSDKSSLYEFVEERIRSEFGIDEFTNHTKFPLIMINSEKGFMMDLNKYEYKQLKDIDLIKGTEGQAIYGLRGEFGVVSIEIK